MRKAVALLLGIAVLGVIGIAAVQIAPRVRLRWRIHELASPDHDLAGRAFDAVRRASAADLHRERAALLPALDAFIAQTKAEWRDGDAFLAGQLLVRIGRLDGSLLLDARRFEALEPAAYWALACLAPERIPRERCEMTLEPRPIPGAMAESDLRACFWSLEGGRHPDYPFVVWALRFRGRAFEAKEMPGQVDLVDLGDRPLEAVDAPPAAPLFSPRDETPISTVRVPAVAGHTYLFRRRYEWEIAVAFRVTALDSAGRSVHLVWRVLRAQQRD
jgi:hypothetical protein